MKDVLDKHYKHLAEQYDEFLYYSPDFVRRLTRKMIDKLRLEPHDRLVDLGCGTAMYSLDILEQVPLSQPVIGVDPYAEMLAQIPEGAYVETVNEDALAWARRPGTVDKILIKETIHHIPQRRALFEALYQRLRPGGILLLVHVPPSVEYPLFRRALERVMEWHAEPGAMIEELGATGFRVERDSLDYRHAIPKEKYFKMVQNCYMSALSSLEPAEIRAGLAEMEREHAAKTVLRFTDHFDYITAVRP